MTTNVPGVMVIYDDTAQCYDIYVAGVIVMTFLPDNGIFIRRVVREKDIARMKDAAVKISERDRRVEVF